VLAAVDIGVVFKRFEVRDALGRHSQLIGQAFFKGCGEG
jgi:hypothetical protein